MRVQSFLSHQDEVWNQNGQILEREELCTVHVWMNTEQSNTRLGQGDEMGVGGKWAQIEYFT